MRYQKLTAAAFLTAFLLVAPGVALPVHAHQTTPEASLAAAASALPGAVASPFASDAEVLDFLRHAEVVAIEEVLDGITKPRKVLLERDGVQASAVFRDIEESYDGVRLNDGTRYLVLRDSALFEVAAYRMAVMLGLDNVPPTVVREIDNTKGSLQMWVNDAMSEKKRRKEGIAPPNFNAWLAQMRTMSLFDFLVGNIDRHTGNYLLDEGGKLWFIDHTRAFQRFLSDWTPAKVAMCEQHLWERLQVLNKDALREELSDVLTPFEIGQLADRLDGLVEHINEQIALRGEHEVIVA